MKWERKSISREGNSRSEHVLDGAESSASGEQDSQAWWRVVRNDWIHMAGCNGYRNTWSLLLRNA